MAVMTADEVYTRSLRAAGLLGLHRDDWPYETPAEHAARQPARARAAFERAVRFSWLLAEERCREALREAARLLQ